MCVCVCACVCVLKAQLLEQEEREKESRKRTMTTQKGSSRFGGHISTFSLGSGLTGARMPPVTTPHTVSQLSHMIIIWFVGYIIIRLQ